MEYDLQLVNDRSLLSAGTPSLTEGIRDDLNADLRLSTETLGDLSHPPSVEERQGKGQKQETEIETVIYEDLSEENGETVSLVFAIGPPLYRDQSLNLP